MIVLSDFGEVKSKSEGKDISFIKEVLNDLEWMIFNFDLIKFIYYSAFTLWWYYLQKNTQSNWFEKIC